MPTNLPPQYFDVEKQYRAAKTTPEKIELLEEMLSIIPKHKGTDKLRADLRKRLSKLKASSQASKKAGKRDSAFHIDKEGAGQAVIIGYTNVGKSSIVTALTNASPEVSPAPFTTWKPTPGMMQVEDIQVQLLDTPPLDRDYVEPELMDLIRRADVILLTVDLQANPIQQLEETIALLAEHRIIPIQMKDEYEGARRATFRPVIVLVNKNDDESLDDVFELFQELIEVDFPMVPISVSTGRNLEGFKRAVVEQLEIIRVYSKIPGKDPDLRAPYVMRSGSTVEEFAAKVHQDFVKNLKSARIWGSGVFDGQMVGRDHLLQDGDIVELRI